MKVYPTGFEATDDGSVIFRVTEIDGFCANVEIKYPVNTDNWPEISTAIYKALEDMKLGEQ